MDSIASAAKRSQEARESRLYSVYVIRCKENGKIYVGCTDDVQRRVKAHMLDLRHHRKRSCGPHSGGASWQKDYDLYGEGAFEYYILQDRIANADKASVESYWINRLHSKEEDHGYNSHHAKSQPVPIPFVKGLPPEEPRLEAET